MATIRNMVLAAAAALVLAAAAAGCKNSRVVSDNTLADMFHDAFLANAYVGSEHVNLDSLEIYEPIFRSYGYTAEDVRYTIGNFSRRKSARLGTVVERAISRLESENDALTRQVVILDTIRNTAIREGRRIVYSDSLIRVSHLADTVRLRVEVLTPHPGEYTVSYTYADSSDIKKYPRRASMWLEQTNGGRRSSYGFRLRQQENVRKIFITDTSCVRIVLEMGNRDGRWTAKAKAPDITVRDLKVEYTPDEKTAVDNLFLRHADIKIFADEFYPAPAADSLAPAADTTRVL